MIVFITLGLILLLTCFVYETYTTINKRQKFVFLIAIGAIMGGINYRLYVLYDFTYYYIMALIAITFLTFCSIKDVQAYEVPMDYLLGTMVVGLILLFYNPNITLMKSLIGIGIGGIVFLLSWVTKGALGQGDAWVIMTLGLLLGWQMTVAILLYGLVLSGIFGGYLLIIKGVSRKTKVPFTPFLWGGALLIYLI